MRALRLIRTAVRWLSLSLVAALEITALAQISIVPQQVPDVDQLVGEVEFAGAPL